MRSTARMGAGLLGVVTLACGGPLDTSAPNASDVAAGPQTAEAGVSQLVTGGGQFVHPVFGTVTFSFTAVRHADGSVNGRFEQNQFDVGFSYKGDVTCFAVDQVNHRAWIGGVLTQSNDPDPVTQVGDDAWFRVLDLGSSNVGPDRSTFLGFEGAAGIITSEEYCAAKIWPDGNARTWPVEQGNIVIQQ
jgi:hypothetical protein